MGAVAQSVRLAALAAIVAAAWIGVGPALAEDAASGGAVGAASLPSDLSPWGMFLSADVFVKGVMIALFVASVATWTVALSKGLELAFVARKLDRQNRLLERAASFSEAVAAVKGRGGLESALRDAEAEIGASADLEASGIKERIGSRLERAEARFARGLARATGILATTGATAPFVGLFGTVWGVMNSFIGISRQHTTNLAVVAPGIAEALLATALGLAAAIPAVVFYNMLARSISGCRGRYADGAAAVLRSAGRDLERARAEAGKLPRARSLAAE